MHAVKVTMSNQQIVYSWSDCSSDNMLYFNIAFRIFKNNFILILFIIF